MNHMNLFKCNTIEQFKIGADLAKQGLKPESITSVELLDRYTVKLYNGTVYMIVRWVDGHAEIDQT